MSPDTWSSDLDGAAQHARDEMVDAWLAGDALDDAYDAAEEDALREMADDDDDFYVADSDWRNR